MSATTVANPPSRRSGVGKLWLGLLALVAAGVALAWFGAGSLRPDVSSTGLEFRVIKEGIGEPIREADAAGLDYVLTLDDGNVFDSSEAHGGPQPFAMATVFPGFAEAMRRMREGGQYRFTMPQKLAFADGPPPGFPPSKTLTFDVRVRKIVRGAAATVQQQPQQ